MTTKSNPGDRINNIQNQISAAKHLRKMRFKVQMVPECLPWLRAEIWLTPPCISSCSFRWWFKSWAFSQGFCLSTNWGLCWYNDWDGNLLMLMLFVFASVPGHLHNGGGYLPAAHYYCILYSIKTRHSYWEGLNTFSCTFCCIFLDTAQCLLCQTNNI